MIRPAPRGPSGDFRKFAPGDHCLSLSVGNDRRPFRLHVPENLDPRFDPVIAFDGVTLQNPEGSMARINGLDDASKKYKFAAIYPIPKTRYFGIVASWNAQGAYLSYRPDYDDVDYVREIFAMLQVERAYAIGFSAGAQFAHILAGRLPGIIAGVGSICGTWLGTEPPPPPGTALLVIHGEEDPVEPYQGGNPPLKIKLLAKLGNRNVLLSKPCRQAEVYAEANGYGLEPEIEDTEVKGISAFSFIRQPRDRTLEARISRVESPFPFASWTKRAFGPGLVPVVEYLIKPPWGGHTYHGRRTGEGTESRLSPGHGRPLPPEVFSANDVFAATMGFARGGRAESHS
jgi:poly(3-hydroxybutyrate) depolymerase